MGTIIGEGITFDDVIHRKARTKENGYNYW